MIKYKVQIDMSEFGESAIWQDVAGVLFDTHPAAMAHIEWMQREYGEKIAYRAQQITEQRVQDRKTGEFYNPQERFDRLMNRPEIQAVFKRLSVR